MPNEVNPVKLKAITDDMIAAISSPAYVEAMKTMKATPVEKRLAVAAKLLSPEALRKKGVPLPADMRISSRYFEPGNPSVIYVDEHGARLAGLGDPGPVGAWGCACGGAATVCGGAGGGS
jgi:hypothetical protein